MKVFIVTGMSGAGKSQALRKLEDLGYYCVDNLPVTLTEELVEVLRHSGQADKVALGIDARAGVSSDLLSAELDKLAALKVEAHILFLDAGDNALIRRYSQTRRNHPLAREGLVQRGIEIERRSMAPIRDMAQHVIDTSELRPAQLDQYIERLQEGGTEFKVFLRSFGFKRGIPLDADNVFDVRFLPNPFWQEELRKLTGLSPEVRAYVMQFAQAKDFVEDCASMLVKLLPFYQSEGKPQLNVAFGCTGGMHRSVCIAQEIYCKLHDLGVNVIMEHRDIDKDLQQL